MNEMKQAKTNEFAAEYIKDNGRSTTFQAPKNFREQLRKKMEEEKLAAMAEAKEKEWQQQQRQGIQGDQLSLKEKRLAEINKVFAQKDKQKTSKGRGPGDSGPEQSLLKQIMPDLALF